MQCTVGTGFSSWLQLPTHHERGLHKEHVVSKAVTVVKRPSTLTSVRVCTLELDYTHVTLRVYVMVPRCALAA